MSNINWNKIAPRKNPYKTPEGYFDGCAKQIMAKIDEQQKLSKLKILYIMSYSATAAAIIAFVFIGLWSNDYAPQQPTTSDVAGVTTRTEPKLAEELNSDDIYDYLMLNNNKIYTYATEED